MNEHNKDDDMCSHDQNYEVAQKICTSNYRNNTKKKVVKKSVIKKKQGGKEEIIQIFSIEEEGKEPQIPITTVERGFSEPKVIIEEPQRHTRSASYFSPWLCLIIPANQQALCCYSDVQCGQNWSVLTEKTYFPIK
ncbi:hypothetical protein ABEB36_015192 [Hypothenemus hampei]|uniref:Uncharacterized protein n=1 Tax=Hypothenemus hampei TaxID=57062 RepID=A0ABD1E2R2_HYPHA